LNLSREWRLRGAIWVIIILGVWLTYRWSRAQYLMWDAQNSAFLGTFDATYGVEVQRLKALCLGQPLSRLEQELGVVGEKVGNPDTPMPSNEDGYRFNQPPIIVNVQEGQITYIWPHFPKPKDYMRALHVISWLWGSTWFFWFLKLLVSRHAVRLSAEALGVAIFVWLSCKVILDANHMDTVSEANNPLMSLLALIGLAISIPATLWSWTYPIVSQSLPRPSVDPWWATMLGGIHAFRFWRLFRPSEPLLVDRLAAYLCGSVMSALAVPALGFLVESDVYPDFIPFVWVRRGIDVFGRQTKWTFLTDYIARSRMISLTDAWAVMVFALPILCWVTLKCLSSDMNVRRGRIVRAAIYACDATLPCTAVILLLVTLCLFGRGFFEPAAVAVLVSFIIVIPTILWRLVAITRFHLPKQN
jgi:hypothetical protein